MTTTNKGSAVITTPKDDQILITRAFDAPRRLIYRAYTEPPLVRRWWPGGRGEMTVCDIDLRVGGSYRYVMQAKQGFEVGFRGTFLEIVPNERIVHTEIFEGAPEPGGPANEGVPTTVTFAESGGRTTLTMLMQLKDRAERDMIIATGMADGVQDGMDIMEQLAASLEVAAE